MSSHSELAESLLAVFDRACKLCRSNYDLQSHTPMMLCLNQHICCLACSNQLLQKSKGDQLECPRCSLTVKKEQVMKVRRVEPIIQLYQTQQTEAKRKGHHQYQHFKSYLRTNLKFECNERWLNDLEKEQTQIAALSECMLDQVKHLFLNKNITKATQILQKMLLTNKESNSQYIGLGSKAESEVYCTDIQKWFRRLDGSSISAFDMLGLCFLSHPDYPEQRKFLKRLVNVYPEDYRGWFGLGLVEHNDSKWAAAEELYLKAAKMKTEFCKPFEMLAFIHLSNHNCQQAAAFAEKAIEICEDNIFAHYILAKTLPHNQPDAKWLHLAIALGMDRHFLNAKLQLGILYKQAYNLLPVALEYFEQCVTADPDHQLARLRFAESLLEAEKYCKAKAILSYFNRKRSKIDVGLHFQIGKAFAQANDRTSAIGWIETSHVSHNKVLGNLYYEEGRYDLAINEFNNLEESALDVLTLKNLGECYQKMKDNSQAVAAYSEALLNAPEDQAREITQRINSILRNIEANNARRSRPKTAKLRPSTATNRTNASLFKKGKKKLATSTMI